MLSETEEQEISKEIKKLTTTNFVVKAQIHAGGRGKAGGIKVVENFEDLTKEDLGVDITPRIKQLKEEEPPKREKGIMVKDVAELIQKLKNEAKVI